MSKVIVVHNYPQLRKVIMTDSVFTDKFNKIKSILPRLHRAKHKSNQGWSVGQALAICIFGSIIIAILAIASPIGGAEVAQAATVVESEASDTTALPDGYVAPSRSFAPAKQAGKKDLLTESVSVKADADADWGGIEELNVPKTKSPAEIAAEQEAARRAEEARQAEIARQQAAAAAAQAAASRSQIRHSTNNAQQAPSAPVQSAPASGNGQAVVNFAMQYIGSPYVWGGNTPSGWDCSGYVKWVYAHFGVSLPRVSGDQAGAGYGIGSLSQAMPGDIIANSTHAAIYIGDGKVVNALNPSVGTVVTPIQWAFPGGYSIRRVM